MAERVDVPNGLPDADVESFSIELVERLRTTFAVTPGDATLQQWRIALSLTIRHRVMEIWLRSHQHAKHSGSKRVYYLSMEFLIGRLLDDAAINLGIQSLARSAVEGLGIDYSDLVHDEADPALGNGGLGRLAACYLESAATLACIATGYGIRYENGLFEQHFDAGQQVEVPESWLRDGMVWEVDRPESAFRIGFGGHISEDGWQPERHIVAQAHDLPVVGWRSNWANTLRLWSAHAEEPLDLARFNSGDFIGAVEAQTLARSLSRVLYPDDSTDAGKDLRLRQEYFLTAAAIADILRQFGEHSSDLSTLPTHAAIQLNDTHPTLAGPELLRLLLDEHGYEMAEALDIVTATLAYTNHTLLPEALERWPVELLDRVLPRHLQIIEAVDHWHREQIPALGEASRIITDGSVQMGNLAFILAHRVNGVSALHTELVRRELFAELDAAHPGRIVNQTNGITPRRWLRAANPALSRLISQAIGPGWEADLDRLRELEPFAEDPAFRDAFGAAKRENKLAVADWLSRQTGHPVNTEALFDVQVKRIHEYKRQLLNILQTIAQWQRIKAHPGGDWVPRVKIFGGKAAPGYAIAKQIIRLINDVAAVINRDPDTSELLTVHYPANYNVTMAERLIPAADLSEQISTAGMEASGTGNMKFALNGALTIGTLDGANVEIRELVGPENFFLFGLTAEEVLDHRNIAEHSKLAIESSDELAAVLQLLAEGAFSPDEPERHHGLLDLLWHHDHYLVTDDFDSYDAAQASVEDAFKAAADWQHQAVLNTARVGFFSADRAVRGYMDEIWSVGSALPTTVAGR